MKTHEEITMKTFLMKTFLLFALFAFFGAAQAANVVCSDLPIAAPDPNDALCSVIAAEGLTGDPYAVIAELQDDSVETCKRDAMSGAEIRAAVDATEYAALDAAQKLLFATLTSGGEAIDPYWFGQSALVDIFGSGATLTALAAARVRSISLVQLYGLSPRAGDVEICMQAGG